MVTKVEIARYLGISDRDVTEIDSSFFSNYFKVYCSNEYSRPSRSIPSQVYAEFKITSKKYKKTMVLDGYSQTRINKDTDAILRSFGEARDYAISQFINRLNIPYDDGLKVDQTGTYAFVYIIPKSHFRVRE